MNNERKGTLRIGTSGIVVPGGKETFPAAFQGRSRLTYFGSLFNTLEVNSTFKKIPKQSTFERWTSEVAEDFQFTLKVWKDITHVKPLNVELDKISTFVSSSNIIGSKMGCLLVQFPASVTSLYQSTVQQILQKLREVDQSKAWRLAVEFRSETWYNDETYCMLEEHDAVMVLHDMPKSKCLNFNQSSKFSYWRFHGPKGDYRGSYSLDFLQEMATKIKLLLNNGSDVYVYFNNTMGDAFKNAMSFKSMITDQSFAQHLLKMAFQ